MVLCTHTVLSPLALVIVLVLVVVLVADVGHDVGVGDRERVTIIGSGLVRVGVIAMRHSRWMTIVQLYASFPTHDGGKARLPGMTMLLLLFLCGAAGSGDRVMEPGDKCQRHHC